MGQVKESSRQGVSRLANYLCGQRGIILLGSSGSQGGTPASEGPHPESEGAQVCRYYPSALSGIDEALLSGASLIPACNVPGERAVGATENLVKVCTTLVSQIGQCIDGRGHLQCLRYPSTLLQFPFPLFRLYK